MVSPMWNTEIHSDFCEAPLRSPLSHRDLVPVGSSSTLSLTFWGSRTIEMFPNLSATVNEKCRNFYFTWMKLAHSQICKYVLSPKIEADYTTVGIIGDELGFWYRNFWFADTTHKLNWATSEIAFQKDFNRLLSSTYLQQSKNPTYTSL